MVGMFLNMGKNDERRLASSTTKGGRKFRFKPKRAKVMGIFSCKGGVGKTTAVANLGLSLFEHLGEDVLVVDANFPAPNLNLHFGMFDPEVTIHDALIGKLPIDKTVVKCFGLPAILGSIVVEEDIRPIDLKSCIEPMRGKYRLILIDSAPGVGMESIAAIKACDELAVITTPEVPAVASTLRTLRVAERYDTPIIGTIVNMVSDRTYELSLKEIRKTLGMPIIGAVPEDVKVRESTAVGIPIVRYEEGSPSAAEFRKLGKFFLKLVKGS